MADTSMRDRILDAAERRARTGGYHGFSFRDIAADVGIKSASVHYHFPTKEGLVEAVAARYADRAREHLSPAADAADAVGQVANLFRTALRVDDQMCLCGLLGAERDTVPVGVANQAGVYFRMLIDYLAESVTGAVRPEAVVASLEGALILARTLDDPDLFDGIVDELRRRVA